MLASILFYFFLVAFQHGDVFAAVYHNQVPVFTSVNLRNNVLGVNRCNYGPAYWCNNLTNSFECNQFIHCHFNHNFRDSKIGDNVTHNCMHCINSFQDLKLLLNDNPLMDLIHNEKVSALKQLCKVGDYVCMATFQSTILMHVRNVLLMDRDQSMLHSVCLMSNLCKNDMPAVEDKSIDYRKIFIPSVNPLVMSSLSRDLDSDDHCEYCKLFFMELKNLLSNTTIQNEFKLNIEHFLCGFVFSDYKAICKAKITEYLPAILNFLQSEINPSWLCKDIHLCKAVHTFEISTETCVLCESFTKYIFDYLKNRDNQISLRNEMDRLCEDMGHEIGHYCEEIVNTYFELFIQYLIDEYTVEQVCVMLDMCQSNDSDSVITSPLYRIINMIFFTNGYKFDAHRYLYSHSNSDNEIDLTPKYHSSLIGKGGANCLICDLIVNHLHKKIVNNKVELRQLLLRICSELPGSYSSECTQYIQQDYEKLYRFLVGFLSHSNILCSEIGFC